MRVCVKPIPTHLSRAMFRVANALEDYAPKGVEIVKDPRVADLQFLHVIGPNWKDHVYCDRFVAFQYCRINKPKFQASIEELAHTAEVRFSYYTEDMIATPPGTSHVHTPLGVSKAFNCNLNGIPRNITCMSSGHVAGFPAEAIQEVAEAVWNVAGFTCHLGPYEVQGFQNKPPQWSNVDGVQDSELALLYQSSRYVSGLRFMEGFELPVLEGLACGARPIVFDRPDMRQWYDGHARFVKPSKGDELIGYLTDIFKGDYWIVGQREREHIVERFNWETIAKRMWECML